MFKPWPDRVRSTYALMQVFVEVMLRERQNLLAARESARMVAMEKDSFPISWLLDTGKKDSIAFLGYEAGYKTSEVTGQSRLFYDREKPFEKTIPYFAYYKPSLVVERPVAYIIPQAYREVLARLYWNGVAMKSLAEDRVLSVDMYRIDSFSTTPTPYEGHYLHRNVQLIREQREQKYFKGDVVVFLDQPALRYIIETLEPQAPDSWFAWNFFDGILMQKEYFSPYIFEETAAALLSEDELLAQELEKKKAEDPAFAKSAYAQLTFIYRRSRYYETTHRLYPVGRLTRNIDLPLVNFDASF